jgi:hypothetical protein
MNDSLILGNEYDNALRDALRIVLVRNGAVRVDASWIVCGTQEIEIIHIRLGNDLITIESETFIGLTISGPKLVVEDIAKKVNWQLGFA